jgi:hypothetical protein
MMHQIQLNGKFYRSWTGACPGIEDELMKAKASINGFSYHEVEFADYPEGEDSNHWDIKKGIRLIRNEPKIGYKYASDSIDAVQIEMTLDEKRDAGLIEAEEVYKIKLSQEEVELLKIFDNTKWYEERASDYKNSNGVYGKEMPLKIYEIRQNARNRISEIREILSSTENNND